MTSPVRKFMRMLLAVTVFSLVWPAFAQSAPALSSLSLAEAEALWAANSREVKMARVAVEGAEADTISAGQRPNPDFSVQVGSLTRNPGVGAGGLRDKQMDTQVGLSQLIERGDKREHRVRSAQSRLDASRQDLADALRGQRLVLRQAYYDLKLAEEKGRILQESAALYRKSADAARLRLRVGDIAAAEASRTQVESLRAENEARQAANELLRAQLNLAYLIGQVAAAASIRVADEWPAVAGLPAGSEIDVDRRPDVQAALKRVQAAEAARDLARALKKRDVTVGLTFDHNPTGTTYAPNSYGIGVTVPLFVNYAYEGEIRRAEADLDTAREQLEQVRALALADAARARGDLEGAAQRSQRYEQELLTEAERAARAAEFAYRNGALGLMDLLDARRTYKATQIDAAMARADYAKSLAAWRAAWAAEEQTGK